MSEARYSCVNAQSASPLQGSGARLVIERVTESCVFGRFEGVFPVDFAQATRGGFSLDFNGHFQAQRCSRM